VEDNATLLEAVFVAQIVQQFPDTPAQKRQEMRSKLTLSVCWFCVVCVCCLCVYGACVCVFVRVYVCVSACGYGCSCWRSRVRGTRRR